ncbi:MAG: Ribosome biogenesis protein [Chaenotheca gracillima]|nr:MAG: Ribosome biogenesis protein [Chaenotheca gracillima]
MLARTIRKSVLDTRWQPSALPPSFLLPRQSRHFNNTTPIVDSESPLEPPHMPQNQHLSRKPTSQQNTSAASLSASRLPTSELQSSPNATSTLHSSIKELLPLLRAQPNHYVTIHLHDRPYLLTVGDMLHLPFHMPDVVPGDILRLTRVSLLGSRDYTLKGAPYVDERLFECRACVIGIESEPMRIKEKTRRRQRRVKTVKSKHRFTVLRLAELKINDVEDIEGDS